MAPEVDDPRMISVKPKIRYNTIGGVNGPLVVLDNVSCYRHRSSARITWLTKYSGQIPKI